MKKSVWLFLGFLFAISFVSAHWGCVGGESNYNVNDYLRRPVVDVELLPSAEGNVTLKITADFCQGGSGNYANFNDFNYVYMAMGQDSTQICKEFPNVDLSCGIQGDTSRGACAVFAWGGQTYYPTPPAVSLLEGSGTFSKNKFDLWGITYSMEDNEECVNDEMFHVEREIELTIADYNLNYAGGYLSVAFGRNSGDSVFSFPSELVDLPTYNPVDFCYTPATADNCSINEDESSCSGVNGCYWNTKAFCEGSKYTSAVCWDEYEMGTWCEDVTYTCSAIGKTLCNAAPDRLCLWVPAGVCLGTPDICTGLDVDECAANSNCAQGEVLCGNGDLNYGEECDDGNVRNYDSCSSSCLDETYDISMCGDGTLFEGIEECDDGNVVDNDGCSSGCELDPYGEIQPLWLDLDGIPITDADRGDTVMMIAEDLNPGQEVTFEIYERDALGDDSILVGDEGIVEIADDSGFASAFWTIKSTDLSKTSDLNDFYFTVGGLVSEELSISNMIDDSPMELTILSPLCGEDFLFGEEAVIEVSLYDVDDLAEGTLSINGDSFDLTMGDNSFEYTFTKAGNVQIIANAENTRGEVLRRITNVMIVDPYADDTYVAACLDSPRDMVKLKDSKVVFNASSTRALDCSMGSGSTVDCTELVPGGSDSSRLKFGWTFSDYIPSGAFETRSGYGDAEDSYVFNKTYSTKVESGLNWATLSVSVE